MTTQFATCLAPHCGGKVWFSPTAVDPDNRNVPGVWYHMDYGPDTPKPEGWLDSPESSHKPIVKVSDDAEAV